jgi:hypothetical protein
MVPHPEVAQFEMLTRNNYSRVPRLLYVREHLLRSVAQQEVAGMPQQWLAEAPRVQWFQSRIRHSIRSSPFLQECFEKLLGRCHCG